VKAAPAPSPDASPKVDVAPAAPEAPTEVTTEQLREDIANELGVSMGAYRRAYADDAKGLAGRVLSSVFVILDQRYAIAKLKIDQAVLFHEIKDAVELRLGLRAEPQETIHVTPETEGRVLTEKLRVMIAHALESTDARGTEIAFLTETVVKFLRDKKDVKGLRYVPGVKLEVLNADAFSERIRQSVAALRTGEKKS
jgi:hypothetical protein